MMRPQLPHLGNGDSDILSPIKLPDEEMRSISGKLPLASKSQLSHLYIEGRGEEGNSDYF